MGFDPGIDHMSAMAIITGIREKGEQLAVLFLTEVEFLLLKLNQIH